MRQLRESHDALQHAHQEAAAELEAARAAWQVQSREEWQACTSSSSSRAFHILVGRQDAPVDWHFSTSGHVHKHSLLWQVLQVACMDSRINAACEGLNSRDGEQMSKSLNIFCQARRHLGDDD